MIVILPSAMKRLIAERRFPTRKLIQTLVSKMTLTLPLDMQIVSYFFDFFCNRLQIKILGSKLFEQA